MKKKFNEIMDHNSILKKIRLKIQNNKKISMK